MVYEQNIERTTKEELWARGRPGAPHLVPDHTFVVEAGRPARSPSRPTSEEHHDRRTSPPPVVPPHRPQGRRPGRRRGVHRRLHRRARQRGPQRRRVRGRRPVRRRPRPSPPSGRARRRPVDRPADVRRTGRRTSTSRRPATRRTTRRAPPRRSRSSQAKYGVEVDYQEKIGDNATFVETIKPALVGGLPTGWDLIVLTDWMASQIVTSGWAEKIDQANVPNCRRQPRGRPQELAVGPEQRLPLPVAVGHDRHRLQREDARPRTTSREPTKIADLWAIPADKVTFLTEARDTFGLALLKLGHRPATRETVTDADLAGGRTPTSSRWSTGPPVHRQRVPPGLRAEEGLGGVRLVRRPRVVGRPGRPVRLPRGGRADLDRQHAHPEGRGQQVHGRADDELRLRPRRSRPRSRPTSTTCRRSRAPRTRSRRSIPEAATNPLLFPDAATVAKFHSLPGPQRGAGGRDERAVRDLSGT